MYIGRFAEAKLIGSLNNIKKALIILGARQVGKSTLVRHSVTEKKYLELNFDVETDKIRFVSAASLSPAHAYQSLGEPEILVLDEAQRVPECSRIVKGWIDKNFPAKIIILGSSSLTLLDQSAESLTGRNIKLSLPPLTFDEIISSRDWVVASLPNELLLKNYDKQVRTTLLESLVFGSYPEIVSSPNKVELLRGLASDYLWKDLLQMGMIKTPGLIKKLLMLLSGQIGSEVSTNELATQLQISRQTIERYLDLLEQCFVIFRLASFSTNPRKEVSKSKKIYFWDTGIRNAVIGDFTLNDSRADIGALWENWVIAEVAKWNLLSDSDFNMHFWRTRSQSEVDLILKRGDKISAYEIKWSEKPIRANNAFRDAYQVETKLICPKNPLFWQTHIKSGDNEK